MSNKTPSMLLLTDLPQPLARGARVWVGYSGGLDSTVLLHALAQSPLRKRLHAIHVHHGLQAAADDWVLRCERQCRDWKLPFDVQRVQMSASGDGPEASARAARYAAFDARMRPGDVLVTAHHRDDQAETVLLNLLRGAGVEGLAAMRPWAPRTQGWHWRPLLGQPREVLRAYAERHGLSWIDDPHNSDERYARSFLRSEIFPRLRRHWPQAAESLARAADNAADAEALIETIAAADLESSRGRGGALSVAAVLALPPPRRQALLRHWLRGYAGLTPDRDALQRIEPEVLRARADAAPQLRIGALELRRYRDSLFAMAPLPAVAELRLDWDGQQVLPWMPGGGLRRRGRAARDALVVRTPQGGERIRLHARAPSRTLKNLFQEAGVPPWIRPRVPLIWRNDELLSVAGRWWSHAVPARQRTIEWQHELPGWHNETSEESKR